MNEKTTYEIVIADKLHTLPLPDMEDAIWARIKTQLDLDLPEGDGGAGGPKTPWGGGWMWSAGLLAFVAALIAVFVLMKKNVNSTNLPDHTTQQTKSNISPKQLKEEPPDTFSKRDGEPSPSPASTGRSIVPGTGRVDSTALVPLAGQLLPDSAQPALVVVPPPPLQDSISKPKPKKRGVPNITDADYRIVPSKRDST